MDLQEAINTQLPCVELSIISGNVSKPPSWIYDPSIRAVIGCVKKPPVEITYTAPTYRNDGTPLELNEIVSYVIEIEGDSVRVKACSLTVCSEWTDPVIGVR